MVLRQISGDLLGFQISRTKENVHVSGGFGAQEASLGQFQDGDTGTNNQCPVREASRTGNGLEVQLRGPQPLQMGGGGLSRGPDPFLSLQGLLTSLEEANCINMIRRRSSSKRREKQQIRNNRRRRRAAFEGSGRAGHHAGSTRANPGAFWNRTERNGTIRECEQKHQGSTTGHRNTDIENRQLQLKLRAEQRHRSAPYLV